MVLSKKRKPNYQVLNKTLENLIIDNKSDSDASEPKNINTPITVVKKPRGAPPRQLLDTKKLLT